MQTKSKTKSTPLRSHPLWNDEDIMSCQRLFSQQFGELCFDRRTKWITTPAPESGRLESRAHQTDRKWDRQTVIPRHAIKRLKEGSRGARGEECAPYKLTEWIKRSWLEDTHTYTDGAESRVPANYSGDVKTCDEKRRQTWGQCAANARLGEQRDNISLTTEA